MCEQDPVVVSPKHPLSLALGPNTAFSSPTSIMVKCCFVMEKCHCLTLPMSSAVSVLIVVQNRCRNLGPGYIALSSKSPRSKTANQYSHQTFIISSSLIKPFTTPFGQGFVRIVFPPRILYRYLPGRLWMLHAQELKRLCALCKNLLLHRNRRRQYI